jgi:CHASE3 domain sensor protein
LTSREEKLHVVRSSFQIFQKTAVDCRIENNDIRSQNLGKITEEIRHQNWAVSTVVVVAAAAAVALIWWWC